MRTIAVAVYEPGRPRLREITTKHLLEIRPADAFSKTRRTLGTPTSTFHTIVRGHPCMPLRTPPLEVLLVGMIFLREASPSSCARKFPGIF